MYPATLGWDNLPPGGAVTLAQPVIDEGASDHPGIGTRGADVALDHAGVAEVEVLNGKDVVVVLDHPAKAEAVALTGKAVVTVVLKVDVAVTVTFHPVEVVVHVVLVTNVVSLQVLNQSIELVMVSAPTVDVPNQEEASATEVLKSSVHVVLAVMDEPLDAKLPVSTPAAVPVVAPLKVLFEVGYGADDLSGLPVTGPDELLDIQVDHSTVTLNPLVMNPDLVIAEPPVCPGDAVPLVMGSGDVFVPEAVELAEIGLHSPVVMTGPETSPVEPADAVQLPANGRRVVREPGFTVPVALPVTPEEDVALSTVQVGAFDEVAVPDSTGKVPTSPVRPVVLVTPTEDNTVETIPDDTATVGPETTVPLASGKNVVAE